MRMKIDRHELDSVTKQSVLPIRIASVVERDAEDRSRGTQQHQTKSLYSGTYRSIRINIFCDFNKHTEHIGICTTFIDVGARRRQQQSLYISSQEGVQTNIDCMFDMKTEHISIYTSFRLRNGWNGGAATNPKCSIYLGVVVAERMLSKVFKNVERMPLNNPGYDFICNNNFAIDVKSACHPKNRSDLWMFAIKRNQEADYFLCIAFDTRKDLNPQHIWLIPSTVLNHLMGTSISISTLDKWAKYELIDKLDDVLACCDAMKNKTTD